MREMGSFFRKKDALDNKRFRKPPFGIQRDIKTTTERELKNAVKAINKDIKYFGGERISVDILKDEFNTIRNWIEKNPPTDLEEDKRNQLGTLEKAARDAFNKIRPAKYKRGDVAGAEQAFRKATHNYLEYIRDNSEKIKQLLSSEKDLYEAMMVIYKDAGYILGERMSVNAIKEEFSTIKDWVKKNPPDSEDKKQQLDKSEKLINDAFNKISLARFSLGENSKEADFRKRVYYYVTYARSNINKMDSLFVNNIQKELVKSEEDAYKIVEKKSSDRKKRISDELIQRSLKEFYEFSPSRAPSDYDQNTCINKLLDLEMINGDAKDYYYINAKPIIPGTTDKNDVREEGAPHQAFINVKEGTMISFSIYRNEDQEWRNKNFPSNLRKKWKLENLPEEYGQALHASDLRAAFYQKAVEDYLSRSDTLGGAAQQPKRSISDFPLRVIVGFKIIEDITGAIFSGFGNDNGVTECSTLDGGRSRILASHFGNGANLMCYDYPDLVGHGKIGDSKIYKKGGELTHIKISIEPDTKIVQEEIVEIS